MKKLLLIFVFCYCFPIKAQESGGINQFSNIKYNNSYYYPYIDGTILFNYYLNILDNDKQLDFKGNNKYLQYLNLDINGKINFTKKILIHSHFVIRPTMSRNFQGNISKNDYFNNEDYLIRQNYFLSGFKKNDLIFEEFFLTYRESEIELNIGKFNPSFGLAYEYDRYSSALGNKFSEEYALKEKWGGSFFINLPFFKLKANYFVDDRTWLSSSLFNRGMNKYYFKSLDGKSNRYNNFSISSDIILDIYKINIGFKQTSYFDEKKFERGYLIGFETILGNQKLNNFQFMVFVENAFITNYRGTKNRNINYLIINLPLIYGNWNFIASANLKIDFEPGYKDKMYFSRLWQLSIGYKFDFGIMLDITKTFGKEYNKIHDNKDTKTNGSLNGWIFKLTYCLKTE